VKCFRLLQEEEEEEEAIISEGTLSVLKGKLAILSVSVSASASVSVSLPPVRVGSCRITYGGTGEGVGFLEIGEFHFPLTKEVPCLRTIEGNFILPLAEGLLYGPLSSPLIHARASLPFSLSLLLLHSHCLPLILTSLPSYYHSCYSYEVRSHSLH
jgi:hypothetical protein